MFVHWGFLATSAFSIVAYAARSPTLPAKRATCTVDSTEAASDLSGCSSIEIASFTVPNDNEPAHASAFATVTMTGEVNFASTSFVSLGQVDHVEGVNINFNGNGMVFNGNGADYWDGLGTNGRKPKSHPFVQIEASGTFENKVVAYNTPAHAFSVQPAAGVGPLTITDVYVNNAAGDVDELGHNTDGFDVQGTDITIQHNQDDCIAINNSSSILLQNNVCSGGHGMSVLDQATVVGMSIGWSSVTTVSKSVYGTHTKAQSAATSGAVVSNVTWTGDTISGATKYGVLITQSYPDDDVTPGLHTPFSNVNFLGNPTSVTVVEDAYRVTID
ncbi:glycoside hydrolase family 28 protein [Daedalea quercina L-15889]|uniref:Glycoside hydrolase family 28 protein n=1 Tax=Daedalea quercina L-15889 TaxID=1314783 RepID=A0A165PVZ1_9APHY|nr:glycoside hydrolase family 28 protein [Daedalea quercina L-15889]